MNPQLRKCLINLVATPGFLLLIGFASPSHAERAGVCSASELSVHPGPSDAGMGKVEVTLTVENRGSHTCVLQGIPRVEAQNARGQLLHFLHNTVPAGPTTKPARVLLEAGQSAAFSIIFGTSTGYSEQQCPGRTSQLLISFPGRTGTKSVDMDLDICTRPRVSPLIRSNER